MRKKHRFRTLTIWKDSPQDPAVLRGKLGSRFLSAFLSDFTHNGRRAIQGLRRTRRQDYLKLALALLPKEILIKQVEFPEMDDAEFAETLAAVRLVAKQAEESPQGVAGGNPMPCLADRTDTVEGQ
jgi:hypothetical protein